MATRQYIGARYVPKFYDYNGSPNWRPGIEYENLTIVTKNGNSYTSKKPVPSNIGEPENNPEYWVSTGLYNEQVEAYRQLSLALAGRVDTVESAIESQDTRIDTLESEITDQGTRISNAENAITDLIENAQRILIVGAGCQYTTINDAITAARDLIASIGGRVLIFILPGEYNEQIVLHPNPGIDFIGYGAKIKGTYSYPNCCLYTNGTGTFVGMYFENNHTDAYAVHMERDLGTETRGTTKFYSCEFVSMQYHAFGCGMTEGSELHLRGCRFYSASNVANSAALYLHNSQASNQATQTVYTIGCWFESNNFDVRIDDACNIAGGTSSPMRTYFYNNAGGTNKVRFFTASYNPDNASHYAPGPNILLRGRGNGDIALNMDRLDSQEIYVPASNNGYISFALAYPTNACEPVITLPDNPNVPIIASNRNGCMGAGPGLSGAVRVQIKYVPL